MPRFLVGAWLFFGVLYSLLGTAAVPFHGDESTQLYMGRDFHYQFLTGNLTQVLYSDAPTNPTEQHLRLLNGTLPKYVYGAISAALGYTLDTLHEQWDWGADWTYNAQHGHLPATDLLLAARLSSALLLAVGFGGIFGLGYALGGWPTALIASGYYLLNPALLLNGRRAMMEGWMLGFSVLTMLSGLWAMRAPKTRSWLALGLSSGLAVASKHTAAFAVLAAFLSVAGWHSVAAIRVRHLPLRAFAGIITAVLLALGVFYALNPAWWGAPLARIGTVLSLRTELLAGQTATFGGYATFGEQLQGWAEQTLVVLPQYYEVTGWDTYISAQIQHYESLIWRGISLGGSSVGALLMGMLCLLGIAQTWRERANPAAPLLLSWLLVTLALTLLLTPLAWQRYYLPAYPIIGLLLAQGVRRLWLIIVTH